MFSLKLYITLAAIVLFCFSAIAIAQTWQSANGPWKANVTDLAIGRASGAANATLYDADATTLYRSTDGTVSWIATSQLGGNPLVVTCKQSTPSIVLAGYLDGSDQGSVKQSINSGNSWDEVILPDLYLKPLQLVTSQANQSLMLLGIKKYGGAVSMKRNSHNGDYGYWADVTDFSGSIQTDVVAIAPHPTDQNKIWAGGKTSGTMSFSKPGGFPESPAVYTKGVFYSTNAGINWSEFGQTDKDILAVSGFTVSGTLYVFAGAGDNKIYRRTSTNNGSTWSSWANDIGTTDLTVNDLRFDGTNTLYAATANGIYKRTLPSGSWTLIDAGLYDKSNIKRIVVDPGNANNVFAGASNSIYKSTDNGSSWIDVSRMIKQVTKSKK